MASGGRHGLAQSVFQVGGNTGSSLGPLLAAFVVVPHGQRSLAWFALVAVVAMVVLLQVGHWSAHHRPRGDASRRRAHGSSRAGLSRDRVVGALLVLALLIFSKYFYLASLSSYYTFYLISKFGVSVQSAQLHLFVFLGAVAAGTIIGGPIGDRIGPQVGDLGIDPRRRSRSRSLLPYANLFWTGVLTVVIGLILASAFSAILVYAQELVPGRVGMVAGMFFGFAFGMGGLGAAALGRLADADQHRVRLPAVRLSAADRAADGVSAGSRSAGHCSRARSASPVATEVSSSPPVTLASPNRSTKIRRTAGTNDDPPVRNTRSMSPRRQARRRHQPIDAAGHRRELVGDPSLEVGARDLLADRHRPRLERELRLGRAPTARTSCAAPPRAADSRARA